MAQSLINVAIEQFADDFDNIYQQSRPKLADTMMIERGVIGKALHSSIAGEIILHDRGAFQSDVPPSDVPYTDVILVFENKTALVPSDIFAQAEVRANERMNLARTAVKSIARAEDQIRINALNATTTTVIPDAGTNLTVEKLRLAQNALDVENVPDEDRTFVMHANGKKALLESTEVTSTDFNSVKALVNGQVDTFLGFRFVTFGNIREGGLPLTGNIRTNFAYHRDSMLEAFGVLSRVANPGVEVDFDVRSRSWLVIPSLRMGAKNILPEGVVKIENLES